MLRFLFVRRTIVRLYIFAILGVVSGVFPFRLIACCKIALDHIGITCGNAEYCITGANPGNGTFVTILAFIMADLQMQGSVAKRCTAFHTLSATNTQLFIDDVFEIGLFNKFSLDGCCGTKLILGTGVQVGNAWFKIAST